MSDSNASAMPTTPNPLPQPCAADARTVRDSVARDPQCLEVTWARDDDDVRQAQRLRFEVFVQEMGARPTPPQGTPPGLDADVFDPYCEHLLVRTPAAQHRSAIVIGTYRLLTPAAARRAGGYYSDTAFDLTRLRPLRERMVELGRACVHPAWRTGGTILALWGALAEFMRHNALDTMIGCASMSMHDGGHMAASLWARLGRTHLAAPEWQARPRLALPIDHLDDGLDVATPALIKGYLNCGARILGAPAWDPDFNTADLPLLMRLGELSERHRRHFFRPDRSR